MAKRTLRFPKLDAESRAGTYRSLYQLLKPAATSAIMVFNGDTFPDLISRSKARESERWREGWRSAAELHDMRPLRDDPKVTAHRLSAILEKRLVPILIETKGFPHPKRTNIPIPNYRPTAFLDAFLCDVITPTVGNYKLDDSDYFKGEPYDTILSILRQIETAKD